jgi:hypothetical protein
MMATSARLELAESGILFINPDPSRFHVFASHPHPVQLSETEFVCTYQRGSAIYAADMEIGLTRSLDGGDTWRDEGAIHDRAGDDRPFSYHDGFLSRLKDGRLVIITFRIDRTDPDRLLFGPTGGIIDHDVVLLFSDDGGRSWSPPRPVAFASGLQLTPANPIIELANGDWFTALDQWHGQSEPGPYKPRMVAIVSSDRGETWSAPFTIADGNDRNTGYWHGKTIPLRDGRLYSTFWTADMSDTTVGAVDRPIHQVFSAPDQRVWPEPESTGILGQTHWPAELPGGQLAMIYTARLAERPGFLVVLSPDGGKTWDLDHQVRVWDSTGWTHLGVHAPEIYPHSHETVAFGAPALMTTSQGDLYASWWCTYASITHIRWARLRVTQERER